MLVLADISTAASDAANIAQALALFVGGFWAYWKFLRGRTFRHRAEVAVSARLRSFDDAAALCVTARMRNTGLSRIPLLPGEKVVLVDWLSPKQLALSERTVFWGPQVGLRRVSVFEEHEELEPGEVISDDLLIPVPTPGGDNGPVVYRVRIGVTTKRFPAWHGDKRRLWSANAVVTEAQTVPETQVGESEVPDAASW